MAKTAAEEFGNTCPVLRVSQKHNADYTRCLRYADAQIHDKLIPASEFKALSSDCTKDLERVANYFVAIRDGLVEY